VSGTTSDFGGPEHGSCSGRSSLARWGAVVWPSFFSACIATMAFFGLVDPVELAQTAWPHITLSRELGYSIGFFGFWACSFSSSLFSALLLGHFFKPQRVRA
jgi:hypothetical protein